MVNLPPFNVVRSIFLFLPADFKNILLKRMFPHSISDSGVGVWLTMSTVFQKTTSSTSSSTASSASNGSGVQQQSSSAAAAASAAALLSRLTAGGEPKTCARPSTRNGKSVFVSASKNKQVQGCQMTKHLYFLERYDPARGWSR
jgi:hypothetical protein